MFSKTKIKYTLEQFIMFTEQGNATIDETFHQSRNEKTHFKNANGFNV